MIFDYYAYLETKTLKGDEIHIAPEMQKTIRYFSRSGKGKKKEAGDVRSEWAEEVFKQGIIPAESVLNFYQESFQPDRVDLSLLPEGSFFLQLWFELTKPYYSRDDKDFYITDNPLKKDKVSHLPLVSPSTWKGALRHTMWHLGYRRPTDGCGKEVGENSVKKSAIANLLFGESRDDEGSVGCLHFYPTFFDRRSVEVLNPHDREKRAGTVPLYLETVPAGSEGVFNLLFVPPPEKLKLQNGIRDFMEDSLKEIWDALGEGLGHMFATFGFGARTSSGFGLAEVIKVKLQGPFRDLRRAECEGESKNSKTMAFTSLKELKQNITIEPWDLECPEKGGEGRHDAEY